MKLKHTALYAKGWYKKTNLVEDVKKTLTADGYIPDTQSDIITILTREVFPIVEKRLGGDAILDMLLGIHPNKYHMYNSCLYDYDFAVIHYFINKIAYMEKVNLMLKIGNQTIMCFQNERRNNGNICEQDRKRVDDN